MDSFIWVPPWVQVRVFGLSGQVLHILITVMCDFANGFSHGYMPEPIELPLGTRHYRRIGRAYTYPNIDVRSTAADPIKKGIVLSGSSMMLSPDPWGNP